MTHCRWLNKIAWSVSASNDKLVQPGLVVEIIGSTSMGLYDQAERSFGSSTDVSATTIDFIKDVERTRQREHAQRGNAQEIDAAPISTSNSQFWIIFSILCVGMICNGLDSNLLGDAAPIIGAHFKAFSQIAWLSASNLIVVVLTLLIMGRLFDIKSPKHVYMVALAVYAIGEAVSGSSITFAMLLCGRALSGLGLAALDVASFTIIALITKPKERPLYLSLVMGVYGMMIKVGPLVAGALLERSPQLWRWCFWIQLPIQGCLLLTTFFFFPRIQIDHDRSLHHAKFDFISAILQAIALALLLVPLLVSTLSLATLIVCYVSLPLVVAAFFWRTKRIPESQRLIPLEALLADRSIICVAIMTFGSNLIIFTSTFYFPQYFQLVYDASPLSAAVFLLPCALAGTFACVFTGELAERVKIYTPLAICASLLEITGASLFLTIQAQTALWKVVIYTVLLGIGAGSLSSLGFAVVMARVDKTRFGAGGSFINLISFLGPVVGISLSGLIFNIKVKAFADMAHLEYPAVVPDVITFVDNVSEFLARADVPMPLKEGCKAAYSDAQRLCAFIFLGAGVLSLVAACVTKHESLIPRRRQGQVDVIEMGEARQP